MGEPPWPASPAEPDRNPARSQDWLPHEKVPHHDLSSWIEAPTGKRGAEIPLSHSREGVTLTMKATSETPYYEISVH
jgi:hypothetical protein